LKLSTAPAPPYPTLDATAAAIDIRDVSFAYGERQALNGLSLTVPSGSIFGLLGPNGAGKSTLLSLLIGRRVADAGQIVMLGRPLSASLRSRVGMVFQEPSLDPHMTVRETMQLQGKLFGMRSADIAAGTDALLGRVALADRASAYTSTLSGGMRRRLELARALLPGPDVLLLDEPTLALDPDSKLALWQHLLEANANGMTLLLATNDVAEAERYCRRVALIAGGRLVAEGLPDEMKAGLRREAVRVEWRDDAAVHAGAIREWPGVGDVRIAGHTTHVTVDGASAFLARLFERAGEHVHAVQIEQSTLEDVYFQLVGRGIAHHPGEDDATATTEATGATRGGRRRRR
jgi:ABC-2 type transport system ATP-binding protein